MLELRGTRVLVMGLGVHGGGLGVARWLVRQGARVTVTDMASAATLAQPLAELRRTEQEYGVTIHCVLGEHRAEDFTAHALVVVNPAVRPDSPWLNLARQAGARIETEMTLFFRRCPAPIIGVTGTKGKTTTTLLTGAMLRHYSSDTVVAGNLRVSALEALDRITPTTPVVLELSSFQLVGLGAAGLSPAFACITNISPDHLNYHGSLAEYVRAKQQIFLHQSAGGVVLLQHALLAGSPQSSEQEVVPGMAAVVPAAARLYTFSGDAGSAADCHVTPAGRVVFDGEDICDVADIQLPGRHNWENVLAATALARSFGASAAHIRDAVRHFHGVEHRLELVAELAGVRFVNDTTATNPAAAQAALASFDRPVVLLAGGADKNLPFDDLARMIARQVKALVLLAGSATGRLEALVRQAGPAVPVYGPYDDLDRAVRMSRSLAEAGDVVLLSPGCASFGMFHNEFHRGDEFRRVVTSALSDMQ